MLTIKTCLSVAIAALAATPALAETSFGDHVSLSGFGTLGLTTTDNSDDAFVRDGAPSGATTKPSWKVDSKLGIQADVKATDWLSGTVQVLTEQRYQPKLTAEFEWAFVKLHPVDGLNIRLGRIAPAVFMVSDSRSVGYANTPVRMPNEVYSLAGVKRMKGGDVSYRFDAMGTGVTATAFAGEGVWQDFNWSLIASKLSGLNLQWDTDIGTFRIGHMRTTIVDPNAGFPPSLYNFNGVGYSLEKGALVLAAELVKREAYTADVNSNGWYVMGGYRFGKFLPYAFAAETTIPSAATVPLNGPQKTLAVGVRWDVVSGAAIKAQFETVRPKGQGVSFTPSSDYANLPERKKTNVLSLAVDFVF